VERISTSTEDATTNTTTNSIEAVKTKQLVLLQAACAEARNEKGDRIQNVRILFDNSS